MALFLFMNINALSFPIVEHLVLHFAYLHEKNSESQGFIFVPFKTELLEKLKKLSIETLFDQKDGIQLRTKNKNEAQIVISLMLETNNLTSLFYSKLEQWYQLFKDKTQADFILDKGFEYRPQTDAAIEYKSLCPGKIPSSDLKNPISGLDNDILKTSLSELKEVQSYIEKKLNWHFELCEDFPLRREEELSVDLGFRYWASKVIEEFGVENTFYIVNTGHSIPIGALLLSHYKIPTHAFMRQCSLNGPNLHRIFCQLSSFGWEICNSHSTHCSSMAWLLDCHCGQDSYFDHEHKQRHILNFTSATYLNWMPKVDNLKQNEIKQIVVLLEYCPQLKISIKNLENTSYHNFSTYLEMLQAAGFQVILRGVDCRSDISKLNFS